MDQTPAPVINPEVVEFEELYFIISNPAFKRIREKVNQNIARLCRDIERLRKLDMAFDSTLAIAGKEHRIDELNQLLKFFDYIILKKNTPTGE
jgi:hypothetical protein